MRQGASPLGLLALAAAICLVGCTPSPAWERSATITGFAQCGSDGETSLRVWFESGLGISTVVPSVVEADDAIEISVAIGGSGDVPAISEEDSVTIALSTALDERAVRDAGGNEIPERQCPRSAQ